jgi:tetratricopeptide (TPR) repeat protein
MMPVKKIHTILLMAGLVSTPVLAQKNTGRAAPKKPAAAAAKQVFVQGQVNPATNRRLQAVFEKYRRGELQKRPAWDALDTFVPKLSELTLENRLAYEQVRAELLFLAGYPLLASEHAVRALALTQAPYDEKHKPLWDILWKTSKVKPIQYLLEELGTALGFREGNPPSFGNNWNYILANAFAAKNDYNAARKAYEKIVMQDRYFMPSQYQLGLIAIKQNQPQAAEAHFRAILNPTAQDLAELRRYEMAEMLNYTHMALARLYYQERRFIESAQHYRLVRRSSVLFYDSIFEQAWALFMAGSVKHALGALYSSHSPYFADRFNPEGKVLESMIYYWVCRYDDARNSLADFADSHRDAVANLGTFLDRQRLSPEAAYRLFENLITGVSGEAIGIPINVLNTAAQSDVMLLVRDQYATLIEELNALETYGIYGSLPDIEPYKEMLLGRSTIMRTEIGSRFLGELRNLKDHFDELYDQSQFLYLELLMSQKDQILGKELHGDSKLSKVTDKDAVSGWSRKTQSWEDDKFEYWWDEIGYQIIDVEPECKL